jgi:hypothetical protein
MIAGQHNAGCRKEFPLSALLVTTALSRHAAANQIPSR